MKNQKQIVIIAGVLIVAILIIGGYFIYKNKQQQKIENVAETSQMVETTGNPENLSESVAVKEDSVKPIDAWQVFQQYLTYLKNHDTKGVNSVLSEYTIQYGNPCPMRNGTTEDCSSLMDSAYSAGIKLNKSSFIYNWSDSKQIILSTGPTLLAAQSGDNANDEKYEEFYIFFTKSKDGTPKFLATYHITTTFPSLKLATKEEKAQKLAGDFNDADKDGFLDKYEDCTANQANPYQSQCSNTNSHKRDSLGDGWWDGVRVFFKVK